VQTANKPRTIAHRRSRAALNWIDFLVIAAIILTTAAIVSTTLARAKAATYSSSSTSELAQASDQLPLDLAMIKAKLRLASGGPWL